MDKKITNVIGNDPGHILNKLMEWD